LIDLFICYCNIFSAFIASKIHETNKKVVLLLLLPGGVRGGVGVVAKSLRKVGAQERIWFKQLKHLRVVEEDWES